MEVTFEIDEIEKTEQILIFDDQFLEELETFSLSLEPINNLDEGAFPVVVIDELINITIIDDDGMCNFKISLCLMFTIEKNTSLKKYFSLIPVLHFLKCTIKN